MVSLLKKKEKDNCFENGSNRLVGHTSGERQCVMVSLLPPPTLEGGALSWLLGNRAQRTASSSVGPVGRESGSASCCHLRKSTWGTVPNQKLVLLCKHCNAGQIQYSKASLHITIINTFYTYFPPMYYGEKGYKSVTECHCALPSSDKM